MSNFPVVQPAFTMQVRIQPPVAVGSAARNSKLMVTPMVAGNVKAEGSFSPAINGEFVGTGNDYIHLDPDEKHLRLNAHAVIKTQDEATIYLNYTGVVDMTPELSQILSGQSDTITTPFGASFIHLTFETDDARYAALENGVWVGAGHFIYEKGESPIVEYKVGKLSV